MVGPQGIHARGPAEQPELNKTGRARGMEYIIIYNAETDFFKVFNQEQAEAQVASLITGGFGADDIQVYEAVEQRIKIADSDIVITLEEV